MQNTHLKIWLFLSVLTSFFNSQAQSPQQLLQQADSLFNAKNYQTALSSYQNLFKANYGSPAAYLKAAYLCEASGRETEAIIYLYRYFLINDDQGAYAKIIELAEKQGLNGYEQTDNDRLRNLIARFSTSISLAIGALAMLSLAFMVASRRKQNKPATMRLAFLSLVILSLLFLFNNFSEMPVKAVVISSDAWLMNGPSPAADRVSAVTPGEMVEVVDQTDVWIQIKIGRAHV